MEYGIVISKNGGMGICKFTNAKSISDFAKIYLARTIKEEGYEKVNKETTYEFLEGWLDHMNELAEESGNTTYDNLTQVIDYIADHITRSNVHLQKKGQRSSTWVPLTMKETEAFEAEILKVFERAIAHATK